MRIFINPGHCVGSDSGACGYGLTEAQIALNISNRVSHYLAAVGYTTKVFQYDGLEEIVDVSNYWDADLFVSIHCNAANGYAQGTETFYYLDSTEGYRLADCIQNQILAKVPVVDRGVKAANFFVIKYTNCPAVLVETAFIDNPNDADLLVEREDDFARAIACGITDYVALQPDIVDFPVDKE